MSGPGQGSPVVTQPPSAGWQVSTPVQNRPSSHLVLSGELEQPVNSLHVSAVQSMPSLQGKPLLTQPSVGLQVSTPSQNRKSSHRKSCGMCWHSLVPSLQDSI